MLSLVVLSIFTFQAFAHLRSIEVETVSKLRCANDVVCGSSGSGFLGMDTTKISAQQCADYCDATYSTATFISFNSDLNICFCYSSCSYSNYPNYDSFAIGGTACPPLTVCSDGNSVICVGTALGSSPDAVSSSGNGCRNYCLIYYPTSDYIAVSSSRCYCYETCDVYRSFSEPTKIYALGVSTCAIPPTPSPTKQPSRPPSFQPSFQPTTRLPSFQPTTRQPSWQPTFLPTDPPTFTLTSCGIGSLTCAPENEVGQFYGNDIGKWECEDFCSNNFNARYITTPTDSTSNGVFCRCFSKCDSYVAESFQTYIYAVDKPAESPYCVSLQPKVQSTRLHPGACLTNSWTDSRTFSSAVTGEECGAWCFGRPHYATKYVTVKHSTNGCFCYNNHDYNLGYEDSNCDTYEILNVPIQQCTSNEPKICPARQLLGKIPDVGSDMDKYDCSSSCLLNWPATHFSVVGGDDCHCYASCETSESSLSIHPYMDIYALGTEVCHFN
jgi:hypothetical protein